MTLATKDGRLYVISGASRSGKTVYTEREIRKFNVQFVWDIEAQYCKIQGFKKVSNRAQLVKLVTQKHSRLKVAFVANGDIKAEFEFFCKCVFHYATFFGECAVVAEELADVTSPAKAGNNWGMLLRRGLKRGVHIYAISQRWAEADKTAIGNASYFVCFRATGDDVRYMSRKTRIPQLRLEGLKPLEFIKMDASNGAMQGGKINF